MIRNISFIVIARNEAFSVQKCLASIAAMPLDKCEVICIDSNSSDSTLDFMKYFVGIISNLSVLRISGNVNAAIARNVGMQYSKKKYIFFVDGDVELNVNFLYDALSVISSGKADAVTGRLDEIVYSNGYEQIEKFRSTRRYYPCIKVIYDSGGTFLVTRKMVDKVGLWDERMVRNQDFDFTLRISRCGKLMAIPSLMGVHHSLAYNHRPWFFFRRFYPMFSGMLIRKNLDQPWLLKGVLKNYRVGLAWWGLLLCSILLSFLVSIPIFFILACFGLFGMIDIIWGLLRKKNIACRFFSHYLDPLLIYLGLFFDLNKKRLPTSIERIV
jgi:glycosyltransferase involved in cell wall biosynthesis